MEQASRGTVSLLGFYPMQQSIAAESMRQVDAQLRTLAQFLGFGVQANLTWTPKLTRTYHP